MPSPAVEQRSLLTFVVERYWPGITEATLRAAVTEVVRTAAAMRREGIRIRHMASTLVPADETVFSYFESAERRDVIDLSDRAGLRSDRIIEAVIFGPRVRAGALASRSRPPRVPES